MKKIAISSLMAIIASILLSNIAYAATALDNMQVQIDKNSATININRNANPAPVTKKDHDDDENEHKDNGKHNGEKKKEHKD